MSKKRKTKADLETELSAEKAKLSASEAENKRRKSAIDAVTKEYVCPITLELPVDPVIAEDGRAYNRADIQKHIDTAKKKKEDEEEDDDNDEDDDDDNNDDGDVYKYLRSPLTNEPMGPKLVPAVQIMKGMIQDYEMSYYWVKKAADLNDVGAMSDQGLMLYHGRGVDRNLSEGSFILGMAAALGSSNACFYVGRIHHYGEGDELGAFPKDSAKAKYWLEKALEGNDTSCDKLSLDGLDEAKELLKKLEEGK